MGQRRSSAATVMVAPRDRWPIRPRRCVAGGEALAGALQPMSGGRPSSMPKNSAIDTFSADETVELMREWG